MSDAVSNKPFGELQRFGILGGSFNPIHVGHLSIAQQVLDQMKLEQVILMPAKSPPHKQDDPDMASAQNRLEMCKLAIRDMRGLQVSDWELKRPGISFTILTAEELRAAYGPDCEIRFLIGSDSLVELPTWKEIEKLIEIADFAVVDRREQPLHPSIWEKVEKDLGSEACKKLKASVVSIERVDVSSTAIRRCLQRGEAVNGLLRREVEDYIRKHQLYGAH